MRPAAFLFDLDGTLVDTELAWTRAIVSWLSSHAQTVTFEAVAPLVFGRSWFDIDAALHANFPGLPHTTPLEDAQELRAEYARIAGDPAAQVIPGSVAFFKKAARFAPCAIVSGSPHADVVAAAKVCGLAPLVKLVLGAEDYTRGKPAPDGYLQAAMELDVDASECVVVEDSTAGVRAGRAAGMHVIGLDRNRYAPQDFSGCEWLVRDLSELDFAAVFGDEVKLQTQVKQLIGQAINRTPVKTILDQAIDRIRAKK